MRKENFLIEWKVIIFCCKGARKHFQLKSRELVGGKGKSEKLTDTHMVQKIAPTVREKVIITVVVTISPAALATSPPLLEKKIQANFAFLLCKAIYESS